MPASLIDTPATQMLSVDDQERLVALVQLTPGSADAEAAFERLTTAFLPLLRKVAAEARTVDFDEAFSAALEAFVVHVRRHDVASPVPLAATVGPALRAAVVQAGRTSTTITVRETVYLTYWRRLRENEGSVRAAYDACVADPRKLSPATFLAAHRAILAVASLDAQLHLEAQIVRPAWLAAEDGDTFTAAQEEMAERLLSVLPARQEEVTRLAHGFTDLATLTVIADGPFLPGTPLNARETAEVTGMNIRTVTRERTRALDAMRAAVQGSLDVAV